MRTSSGKYRLDVPEVKAAFLAAETTAERMRAFRADRLATIGAGEAPVPLPAKPRLVYHCIPADAFDSGTVYDLPALAKAQTAQQPMFDFAPFKKYNFDGLLMYEQMGELQQHTSRNGYVQAYGDGMLEAVVAGHWRTGTEGDFLGFPFESLIIGHVSRLRQALAILGATPPSSFSSRCSVLEGLRSMRTRLCTTTACIRRLIATRSCSVRFPWTMEAIPSEQLLKAVLDRLWRASGWSGSPSYDDNGAWNIERREGLMKSPWG